MHNSREPKRGSWISRSALGAALALGAVAGAAAVSSPALAAKKEKAPKSQPSKGFIAVAMPAQKALDAVKAEDAASVAAAKAAIDQAVAAIENQDDRLAAGSLVFNLGSKTSNTALQRAGLKLMIESGKGDPAVVPRFNAAAGQLAYQAGDHAEAQHYLQQAVDGGFPEPGIKVMLAESYIAANQAPRGLAVFKAVIDESKASGKLAPDSWYRRGIASAYKAKMLNEAAEFGAMMIRDYPDGKNVGAAATVVRELGNYPSQEVLDLMRLMGSANGYAEQRDYVEYIQAADPRRLPGETLDVINAGLASGMLKASDTFVSDAKAQATGRMAADKASLASYANDARKPSATEATISGAADALLSYGQASQAEELYNVALTRPGVDTDRTLTRLGIAQFKQGKFAEARQTFAKITGKRQPIAMLWSAYAAAKASPPAAPATASAQ